MRHANKQFYHASFMICVLLIFTTLCAFWQVKGHDFLKFDDHVFITQNPMVQAGLTWTGLKWAFTTTQGGLWHPLIWLSFMLDYQLFGMNSGGFHLINLFFHITNTILLFLVLRRMTGTLWRSAFVAALFALHPLHVESVAWVTERKDVLSTFFWMLTIWAYIRYVESPGIKRYWPVFVCFGIGLMAKPMLVTLPFVLLLLDYWPLGRLQLGRSIKHSHAPNHDNKVSSPFRLLWEKIPFFILTAILSFVTFFAMKKFGPTPFIESSPLLERVATTLIAYVFYMWKMIWPFNLAVYYPRPAIFPTWQVVGACLLLAGISVLAIREIRNRPYLLVGWLWFLGTLIPVSGLVEWALPWIGADRYTYVPLIGLFIMIAWGVPDLFPPWRYKKIALTISTTLLIVILMILTWSQVGYWQNGITLFTRTLKVTNNNWVAHYNLGVELAQKGNIDEAILHYQEALRINPTYASAHFNLGNALFNQGKVDEAILHYQEALRINPEDAMGHNNVGIALIRQGRADEAIFHFTEAIRIDPNYLQARRNLEKALLFQRATKPSK
ncbi:MAG: tetratricopeptide repeat protein [Desulfobacterales bacterium]|nr:tetratricopeptide repeat protein [Desulfobacterales bacterium]